MKILNICMNAPFTEGYSYQDNLLSEYQKKAGHEVTVVTSTKTRDEQGKICTISPCDKVMNNGVRLIRINVKGKLASFLGIYPELTGIINSYSPDFIMIHGLCSFVPVQAIRYKKKNRNCKIIADNHQDTGTTKVKGFPFSQQLFVYRMFWKHWIKNIERVYGTTSWRKQFAHKYYGIPEQKLDTLIMGIDFDRLPKDRAQIRKDIRKELNIDADRFVFVTGGKLDSRKKTLETVRAFNRINDENVVFVIFGSVAPEIKEEFERLVQNDKRIIYIGYIASEKANQYFIASDFGVFAGRHSVLWEEAIGCGLPCLFKKYEEHDHTNVCDNCIRLVESTEDTIFEQMNKVLNDNEYYKKLKRNSEKAAETFSYHAIAKKSVECTKR